MQFFKTHQKRIISAMVLITMLSGAVYFVGELVRPFSYETDIYNAEYDALKKNKSKVDMVFIGASRVLGAFDPKVFEKKLALDCVVNSSISLQNTQGIYFQLKEFFEDFHPKTVVVGVTYTGLVKKETPKIVKLRMVERLHGFNRLEYIKESMPVNEYPDILPLYGYRENLSVVKQIVNSKIRFRNEGIHMKTKTWESMGQGFIAVPVSVPLGNMGIRGFNFDETMIREDTIYYLDKFIQLCKNNNVQLVFVTPPTSMANIYENEGYQKVIDFITGYAKRNNIIYHNLSYLKGKEEFLPDSMFYDYKHINKTGAAIVSEKYAEILFKSLNHVDTGDYFYASLTEMKESVNRIVAVDSKPFIKNNVMSMVIESLQNQDVQPRYQVLLAVKKDDFKPIVNWTRKKNISFKVPKGRQYRVLLRARKNKKDPYYAWMAWEVDQKGEIRKVNDVKLSNKKF